MDNKDKLIAELIALMIQTVPDHILVTIYAHFVDDASDKFVAVLKASAEEIMSDKPNETTFNAVFDAAETLEYAMFRLRRCDEIHKFLKAVSE